MVKLFSNKWTPLFFSNFLGVFNDNLLKNSVIFISIGWALPVWLTQSQLISIVSACLIIPYLFLSPVGGRLSVIYSKKKVFRFFKLLELPIMLIACIAFYYEWVLLAVFAVLLMGIQSCLYSPSKYSLIRDIGGEQGVSYGSGVFETMAFLGILIGTVVASFVSDVYNKGLIYGLFIGVALLGYVITRSISANEQPEYQSDADHLNPVRFLIESYRYARQHDLVNSAVFGASAFWLIGGMLQMNLVIHTKHIYQATNTTTGIVMACAAIGIALGCWIAGKISGTEAKKGLILIGIISMGILFVLLTFFRLNFFVYLAAVFAVAFMGGFFQVPSLALLQQADLGRKLGDMIAYLNLVTFIFVLAGTFLFWVATYFTNENSFAVFGVILGICLLVSFYFFRSSPVFFQDTIKILRLNKKTIKNI